MDIACVPFKKRGRGLRVLQRRPMIPEGESLSVARLKKQRQRADLKPVYAAGTIPGRGLVTLQRLARFETWERGALKTYFVPIGYRGMRSA